MTRSVNAPGTLGRVVFDPVAPFGTVVEVDVVDVVIATDGAGIEATTDATTMSTTSAPPRPSRSVQFAARPPARDLGRVGRPAPSGLASSIVIGPILACREGFGRSGTSEPPGGPRPWCRHRRPPAGHGGLAPDRSDRRHPVSLVDRGAQAGTDFRFLLSGARDRVSCADPRDTIPGHRVPRPAPEVAGRPHCSGLRGWPEQSRAGSTPASDTAGKRPDVEFFFGFVRREERPAARTSVLPIAARQSLASFVRACPGTTRSRHGTTSGCAVAEHVKAALQS